MLYGNIEQGTYEFTLFKLRKARGWSQQKLSMKTDIARNTISELEHGKYSPSVNTLVKLCKALDCTMNDLIKFN